MRELSLMAEGVRGVLNEKLFIYAVSFVILTKPVRPGKDHWNVWDGVLERCISMEDVY